MVVLGQPQALGAVGGGIDLNLCLRQQLADHHQVHIVVVHHEDVGVRRLEALPVGLPLVGPGAGGQREGPQGLFVDDVLVQGHDELRALGVDAVDADLAAHQLHQLVNDAQSQPGPLDIAVLLLVHPPEGVEDIGDILLLHPHAGVLHGVPDPHLVDRLALTPDGEGDRALAGVLHRIVEQVDQNLLDAHLVPAEHAGDGRVHLELELQPLLLGLDPDHVDNLRKERAGLIGDVDDLHLPGFDLRQVQGVVNQRQQQLAGPLDVARVLGHLLRDVLPEDDLVEPDDRVDGRADLVAHAGEEVVFRPVELLDLLFLLLGDLVLLLVHPVQEHEQHAGEQPHHDHGEGGVKKGVGVGVLHGELRVVEGDAVAEQGLRHAQPEKHVSAPSLQGDADIDKAEDEPLRHAAVEPACGEKGDGKQGEQQRRNGRGPQLDALFADAELHNQRHCGKAGQQQRDIQNIPAHGQRENQRDHADACHNAEHALAQADPVVGDDLKPFFYHEIPYPSEYGMCERRAGGGPTARQAGRRAPRRPPSSRRGAPR